MYFNQIITSVGFSIMFCVFISNLDGVPQAVTKAPGEANHNSCATCHDVKGIYEPSIALDVMKTDSTLVHTYTPGETYIVRVRVSATNNPRAYGFQMACLDSLTNSDMGVWSGLGDKVKQQTLFVQQKQRKYLVQSAPKTNGIFMANWKAPGSDVGKIKFYFTGLAVNLNGNTNGDNNVYNQLTIDSPSTSSVTDKERSHENMIYPNPVQNSLTISNNSVSSISLIGLSTSYFNSFNVVNNTVDVQNLPNGLYVIVLKNNSGQVLYHKKLIKY
jgi:hypothetical protein